MCLQLVLLVWILGSCVAVCHLASSTVPGLQARKVMEMVSEAIEIEQMPLTD
jgi:chemotaxis receptor (MCP) glutamine deamidase CheD